MSLRDCAIVSYAEVESVRRSRRDVWEIAAEVMEQVLNRVGFESSQIDGLVVSGTGSGEGHRHFWPQATADYLGLELGYCEVVDIGGCSPVGAVARAAAAISAGLCSTALAIFADCPTSRSRPSDFESQAFAGEFWEVQGLLGPPGAFGLIHTRYDHEYGLDYPALAKLAVTQREHAVLNPNACAPLRRPITAEDYLNSRMVSEPIRLLDCVMPCDGGSALLITSRERAKSLNLPSFVVPVGYSERSNFNRNHAGNMLETGHSVAGPAALRQAGRRLDQIGSFHPYDDFIIAIMLQFEALGYCKPGQGADFIRERSFRFDGDLPLNTGGGQISAGQPGFAGGGVNLTEAVRQLFGEAGARQVTNADSAMVTGIGWIPYLRNWFTSNVLVLESDS